MDEIAVLADLLHETAQHHDRFEKAAPPHDWWDWYAAYLHAAAVHERRRITYDVSGAWTTVQEANQAIGQRLRYPAQSTR